ncbi:MAG: dehydrogenase [Rhodospirillaceae bacterium]|nr:dehydrogenase [Rhodospirillaceae bacterium]
MLETATKLNELVTKAFTNAGVPLEHAEIVSDHLVASNLAGHDSHGVMRIVQYLAAVKSGEINPTTRPSVLSDSPSGASLAGNRAFGQIAGHDCMALAIEKAREMGVAAVTVSNCYHSGRIGTYAEQAAAAGMIGIILVNAGGGGQWVAPFGGAAGRLGTNPIAIGAPSGGKYPIVLDIATAVAPEGKVRDYRNRQKEVPAGWILDHQGRPTTNPNDLYEPAPGGSLQPLGGSAGYKGFGLSVMIDILAGGLSGAGCCRAEEVAASDGITMLAIKIENFAAAGSYYDQVKALVEHLKSCPPAPGFQEVFVPGEHEFLRREQRLAEGIEVDDVTWTALTESA